MEAGDLSIMRKLSYHDLLVMISMLKPYKEVLNLMLSYFKSTDDFIKFLDLFAGISLNIPSRNRLYNVLLNIQVYNYYQTQLSLPPLTDDKGNILERPDSPLLRTAHKFNMTTQRVTAIVERVGQHQ